MATGSGTGTPAVSPAVVGNYVVGSDIDNWPAGMSDVIKKEIVDRAEQLIERITRDYFYSKTFVLFQDGNGKDKLFLGLIPDILTVTEIKISGVVLTASWYTFDVNSVYLDPEALPGGGETAELMLRLKYKRILFPKGMGNIKITGTYGWTACPAAIKQAAIMLCRYENDETLYTPFSGDLKSEKLGDYAYTLANNVNARNSVGIDEIDRLIKSYIRKKPMMGVV